MHKTHTFVRFGKDYERQSCEFYPQNFFYFVRCWFLHSNPNLSLAFNGRHLPSG